MIPASRTRKSNLHAVLAAASRRDDAYWNAVRARDSAFDGTFYYSVATTGVYCRPSCPARRPKRGNVTFHATCEDAERAGFRACKRCKPGEPPDAERAAAKVAAACRLIEECDVPPGLDDLARAACLSPSRFQRVFKAIVGVTPKAYAMACRQRRLRETLSTSRSVTEAIHASGFNSSGRFYAGSSKALGMTPTEFRSGGKNTRLHYALGRCSLGAILVAASDRGIAAILIGDDPASLVRDLEHRFPKASLIGADRDFESVVARVIGLVEQPAAGLALPLDVRGTAFQHRVWQALRDIPAGATMTYAGIAKRIGRPNSMRAVAGACAANPVAVAIPCHRVVCSDGALSGYRWGVERKRALLEREARQGRGGAEAGRASAKPGKVGPR